MSKHQPQGRRSVPFPAPQQQEPVIPPDVNRPVVIIESPFAGDIEKNVAFACAVNHFYVKIGYATFSSHLYYTQFLDDDNPRERQIGMHCGFDIGARVGNFIIFALPPWVNDLSRGMSQAFDFYKMLEKPCFIAKFNEDGTEIIHGEWK